MLIFYKYSRNFLILFDQKNVMCFPKGEKCTVNAVRPTWSRLCKVLWASAVGFDARQSKD